MARKLWMLSAMSLILVLWACTTHTGAKGTLCLGFCWDATGEMHTESSKKEVEE